MRTLPTFAASQSTSPSSRDVWSRVMATLMLYRSRRALAQLDSHILNDIGISREQALSEAKRAVWDAPSRWRA
ncbi:MAG: DUF1127 domain-containing protein [Pseudorhodobacter sp.]|nr:DUF1127 domain-containing protein [Pseudorhodobacter sp.]